MKKIIDQTEKQIDLYIMGFIFHHELMTALANIADRHGMSWQQYCSDILTLVDTSEIQ